MIHNNKQYIIYNLQEMCFTKKETRGLTRPGSFAYFYGPNPARTCRFVGLVQPICHIAVRDVLSWVSVM